jgi:hypothetical protein
MATRRGCKDTILRFGDTLELRWVERGDEDNEALGVWRLVIRSTRLLLYEPPPRKASAVNSSSLPYLPYTRGISQLRIS